MSAAERVRALGIKKNTVAEIERVVVGPEFQGLVAAWDIEDACEGLKTWLSYAHREKDRG